MSANIALMPDGTDLNPVSTRVDGDWRGVAKRMLRDKVAVACAILLLLVVLAAVRLFF